MALSTSLNNLSLTIAHAVFFLTRPLSRIYPASTTVKLQSILEANLEALYGPIWDVNEPLRNSGRRCITLSPSCLPPRVVYSACIATGVQWFDWMTLLGGQEFDLLVDPGCVSLRFGTKGSPGYKLVTIWADEIPSPAYPLFYDMHRDAQGKTVAQQLLEADKEDEEQLFALIDDEIRAPSWLTPIIERFPIPPRSPSRLSNISSQSPKKEHKQSRRERARNNRVFVDKTRTEVTPYDGGKTTVLTGGVMLGGPQSKAKPIRVSAAGPTNWRAGHN
ncbi:hypothetical protein AMATHDRAFT_148144 [Amanita thiersii Skay4041]|uniref:Anti-proliferative protein domain-containing protein n=1 Tax=Amanita thiersii Skay4041 TaxID=703135 RepID=A0A2A9NLS9_9AGAR|nr:hypothetical protein AMATHDRAFT_148144 [Amanita thiersii Skay4041]